jgi:NAD(P)-dependent dehydrogenase (short-subunit alcohol dehydrogenase family)
MPEAAREADWLRGGVAFVTGANRGIGLAVARELGLRGATVLLGCRNTTAGDAAVARLRDEGLDAGCCPIDVDHGALVAAAVDQVGKEHGRLDVLVNNAGVLFGGTALDAPISDARRAFETNVFGAWRVTSGFAPLLRRSEHGRVVNVSSGAGSIAELDQKVRPGADSVAPYRISKAALNALTRILALELAPDRVLVNAACPGWVRTDMGGSNATRSPAQGADSVMSLVTLPDEGPTGGFYRDGNPVPW